MARKTGQDSVFPEIHGVKRAFLFILIAVSTVLWSAVLGIGLLYPQTTTPRPKVSDGFPDPGRCSTYTHFSGATLVAHAGGGLPHATYTNDREAIDLAVHHGFKFIELDFQRHGNKIILGHEGHPVAQMAFSELISWLRSHPDVSIITDMKTDNITNLMLLALKAGDLKGRFMPQIYHPSEYDAVKKIGLGPIIFTAYNMPKDDWRGTVNKLDLWAVTIPASRQYLKNGIRHPVFLHTVNRPIQADGLYTDCLIP